MPEGGDMPSKGVRIQSITNVCGTEGFAACNVYCFWFTSVSDGEQTCCTCELRCWCCEAVNPDHLACVKGFKGVQCCTSFTSVVLARVGHAQLSKLCTLCSIADVSM